MHEEYSNIMGIREMADCRYVNDVGDLTGDSLLFSAKGEQGGEWAAGSIGAIVADSDVIYGLARMYAAVASNIREDSQAFRTLEEAYEFLNLGDFKEELKPLLTEEAYRERMK